MANKLTVQQIKTIAELAFPAHADIDVLDHYAGGKFVFVSCEGWGAGGFDPLSSGRTSAYVFKALVDECSKMNLEIHIDIFIHVGSGEYRSERFEDDIYTGKFNNESICLAYLEVMELAKKRGDLIDEINCALNKSRGEG